MYMEGLMAYHYTVKPKKHCHGKRLKFWYRVFNHRQLIPNWMDRPMMRVTQAELHRCMTLLSKGRFD